VFPDAGRGAILERPGRVSFREMALRFRDAGALPTRILTSPLIRAVQTAEILSETLRYSGTSSGSAAFPGFDVAKLASVLDDCRPEREIALVGHEPDLGDILTRLLSLPQGTRCGRATSPPSILRPPGTASRRFRLAPYGGPPGRGPRDAGEVAREHRRRVLQPTARYGTLTSI